MCGEDHHDGCINLACFVGWHNCAARGEDLGDAPEPERTGSLLVPQRELLDLVADLRADRSRTEGRLSELREHYAAERSDRIAAEAELGRVRAELFVMRDRAARLEGKVERLESEMERRLGE